MKCRGGHLLSSNESEEKYDDLVVLDTTLAPVPVAVGEDWKPV